MQTMPAKRNYALDAIKVLATIALLFHHHQQISGAFYSNHPNFWGGENFGWARMVELFFMISGFFAYRALKDCEEPFTAFISKKASRLLPTAAVSTGVYCVLTYLHYLFRGKPWFFKNLPNFFGLIVSCLGLQTGFGFDGARLNNPTWFISVLMLCSAVFYLLAWLSKKHGWNLMWVMVFVVIACQNLEYTYTGLPVFAGDPLRGMRCYALGMLLAGFVAKYQIRMPLAILCAALFAACVAFIVFAPAYIDADSAFVFIMCPALILLAQTSTAQRLFCHSAWRTLSSISFNVYIWQSTLQVLLALVAPSIVFSQTVGGLYLFSGIAWAVGTLSHYLIERPLTQYLPYVWKCLFVRK